ncbi:MAG: mechanosensitive ion channel [candidate division KSB1 bacterium]|nr:mechanosensitive ion channel [candidate division KSB1 bacterium]MDZ7364574.1 mechanosensitive ion channel [candidate division KSB1 bacterium]MDZ7402678.1 mechanosensitive ion channel [candidate division KSB1 bacterium]
MKQKCAEKARVWLALALFFLGARVVLGQTGAAPSAEVAGAPVVFAGDTLFFIGSDLGPFSAQERAQALSRRLEELVREESADPDSIRVVEASGLTNVMLASTVIMSVSNADARQAGISRLELANERAATLRQALKMIREEYSLKSLLIDAGITVLLLLVTLFVFAAMTRIFPKIYARLESWEGTVFRSIRFRSHEILGARSITAFFVVLMRGVRLIISLALIYFVITYVLSLFPLTRAWAVKPVLARLLFVVMVTVATLAILRAVNAFAGIMIRKIAAWKGTLIKPVRLKTVEVLPEAQIAKLLEMGLKAVRLFIIVAVAYFYLTLLFSFFEFTERWAGTLLGYILRPLNTVLSAFINFIPNLFFILVIVLVTRYAVKMIHLIFAEVERGKIELRGFHKDWAEPTYKIVRFLVIAFAAVMIFPYLPGSDSPAFKGISVFLGILFSLGSAGAISNIVSGVVLTYMRAFHLGDRVKIADTMGDIVDKTLLVTRVRTAKNVDISIPNAMVLGSHIINFSALARERGLILHTKVTIGYDVPWRKVHELLIAAARATQNILAEPAPFVLQTSLDDFYVSYELNAYTNRPNNMAGIYSELHQNIQDKFNEASVEIMSPHYSAIRDGNQTTVPEDYLPGTYAPPAFRIFPLNNLVKAGNNKNSS